MNKHNPQKLNLVQRLELELDKAALLSSNQVLLPVQHIRDILEFFQVFDEQNQDKDVSIGPHRVKEFTVRADQMREVVLEARDILNRQQYGEENDEQ